MKDKRSERSERLTAPHIPHAEPCIRKSAPKSEKTRDRLVNATRARSARVKSLHLYENESTRAPEEARLSLQAPPVKVQCMNCMKGQRSRTGQGQVKNVDFGPF